MGFKLISDGGKDIPIVVCDVCGKVIGDFTNDLASGARGTLSAPGNVVLHHKACPTIETLHTPIGDFFRMFMIRCRVGTVSSDGVTDVIMSTLPSNGGFE